MGGTIDQLFTLKQLTEKYLERGKKLTYAILTLKKPLTECGKEVSGTAWLSLDSQRR